ncbi:hypothetical protein SLA2020_462260 [Shorea laevis]
MGRFSWLGLCRRRLLPTTTSEWPVYRLDWRRGVSAVSAFLESLNRKRALHSCSSVIGKHVDFKAAGMPLVKGKIILVIREMKEKVLAKKCHPDANKNNPSAKRKFQEIRDACEVWLCFDDPIFARDGADVYVDSKISLTQAIFGGKVQVPILSGKTEVKIPKGVQPGQFLVLRGNGLPKHGFLEEIENERKSIFRGNWWEKIHEHVMGPDFFVEFSLFFLILVFLNKIAG